MLFFFFFRFCGWSVFVDDQKDERVDGAEGADDREYSGHKDDDPWFTDAHEGTQADPRAK